VRRVAAIWALVVAGLVGVLIWDAQPKPVAVPNSHLVFDRPASWHSSDRAAVLDPGWAIRQKERFPEDAILIDEMVEDVRSGNIDYAAWIDLDGNTSEADGWIRVDVSDHPVGPEGLLADALASVDRQPLKVLPGTTAVDVTLAGGPAVRLDWSFELAHGDGTSEIVHVRTYWLEDSPAVIAFQLTTYGVHPEVVATVDAVASTFRWAR
jgi:hypothetical protein